VSGRRPTTTDRRARAQRIIAAARAGASTTAIAADEKLSDRQVRRILAAAEPDAGAVAPLPVVGPLELDPFQELAAAVAVHRESIDTLRTVAHTSANPALRIGAAKGAAAASSALVDLLARTGTLPPSVFAWRSELAWRVAWDALFGALEDAGVEADAFSAELGRRLAHDGAIDVELVGLGPEPEPLRAAA
jgi:uncharacterized protein (DUF433 family)